MKSLECGGQVLGLGMSPKEALACTGLVSGLVQFWKYEEKTKTERLFDAVDCGEASCRVVEFNHDGSKVVAGCSNGDLVCIDVEDGEIDNKVAKGHEHGLSCLEYLSENLLVSADEEGMLKIWDSRLNGSVMSSSDECHKDYISQVRYHQDKNTLLSAGGDGKLGVYELRSSMRRLKFMEHSDEMGVDLLSMQVVCNGGKVVVGTLDGVLLFWNWGEWTDISDRFPGHPESVQSILTVKGNDSVLLTGSGDGMVRVIQLFPHKLLGILGDPLENPIERLCWSHDQKYVASLSHDELVRFWDAGALFEEDSDDEEVEEQVKPKQNATTKTSKSKVDDEDDEEEEDEDDEEEEEEEKPATKKVKRKINLQQPSISSGETISATKLRKTGKQRDRKTNKAFFSDL